MAFTVGNDNWTDTKGLNDVIDALGGDDTLDGGAGNDILFGNLGNDLIAGGAGIDTVRGGDGNDVLDGGEGNDTVNGDAGDDIGYGGTGDDTLNGGTGNDYLFGGGNNDKLFGGAGSDVIDGGEGNDTLYDKDNTAIYGDVATEIDEMIGGDGNDTFYGGYDTMFGGAGDDVFNVKNKATVIGGIGNDTITVTNTNSTLGSWLEGGLGSDKLTAGSGNDVLFSGYGADTLIGGLGNDSYVITFDNLFDKEGNPGPGTDTITDVGGFDTVYYIRDFSGIDADGRDDDAGSDGKEFDPLATDIDYYVTLAAGIENGILDDQVYVNTPNKLTYVSAWLNGNNLNNTLKGSNLYDILDGGAGNDTISAGDGGDVVFVGEGTDIIDGGAGQDIIAATISYSLLNNPNVKNMEHIDLIDVSSALNATGNNANNILYGNSYNNTLSGNGGNDILDGWFYSTSYAGSTNKVTGLDTMIGGSGNDTYRIDNIRNLDGSDTIDTVKEDLVTNGGTDTVQFKGSVLVEFYQLTAGVENLTIVDNLKEGVGNNLNNRIIGDSKVNILKGQYGDDYLDGGTGIDVFIGGYGDDTYVLSDETETITEAAGQGADWAQSEKINLDLAKEIWGGSIENGKLTGKANLNLFGSTANNRLLGNDGINRLDGKGGSQDILQGGFGDDVYVVDTITDILTEEVNSLETSGAVKKGWIDSVESYVNFSLETNAGDYFENLSLYDGAATTATGNKYANTLLGNSNANTLNGLGGNDNLNGGAGIDTLVGGEGDDTYILSTENDIVKELAGLNQGTADTLVVVKDVTSLTANVENLILNSVSAKIGIGNTENNVITGNEQNNTLSGLAGNDTLLGKDGNDVLTGGTGADVLNLAETTPASDKVIIAVGDSPATFSNTADRIVKFGMKEDTLDLSGAIKFKPDSFSIDGQNSNIFKSHTVLKDFVRFDDSDSYSSPVSITATNLGDAIEYLKKNITDSSTIAFLGSAPDPTTTTGSAVNSTWIFQDNGTNDTLVALVGVTTATSLSSGAFSPTDIHLA
jgi:Ca2+-binding RTX toxin-like protein